MLYQGTVWGPVLWNLFFADSVAVVRRRQFQELLYADDLTVSRAYPLSVGNNTIMQDLNRVQTELHNWGSGNRVEFDSSKESLHILSRISPFGGDFVLLGIPFDAKLSSKRIANLHTCSEHDGFSQILI